MKERFINECKIIQQNCTYTAEAHHQMASIQKSYSIWLQVIPSVCAALTGTLVAAGFAKTDLLFVTIISAVVSAVANVINPNKAYNEHLNAAKSFTTLKHDARFLHESLEITMSDDAFASSVQLLHKKYNDLVKIVPATNSKAFVRAQEVIKSGAHDPDTDGEGKIK